MALPARRAPLQDLSSAVNRQVTHLPKGLSRAGSFDVAKPSAPPVSSRRPSTPALPEPPSCVSAPHSPRLDQHNRGDPLHVVDLLPDIFEAMKRAEGARPAWSYLAPGGIQVTGTATPMTANQRHILVDWLSEVHSKFRLTQPVMAFCVEIMDRFFQVRATPKKQWQLIAVAALLIASKYEEIFPPPVSDMVFIAANTYTGDQIVAAELEVLNALHFSITVPTLHTFASRFWTVLKADPKEKEFSDTRVQHLIHMLSELALLSYDCMRISLSQMAAGCVYLARKYVHPSASAAELWTPVLEHYSGYPLQDLVAPVEVLNAAAAAMPFHRSRGLHRKFQSSKYEMVATISALESAKYATPNQGGLFF